jgi:hypothetical protein
MMARANKRTNFLLNASISAIGLINTKVKEVTSHSILPASETFMLHLIGLDGAWLYLPHTP